MKKMSVVVAAALISLVALTGCGADKDAQACMDKMTKTLADSGNDRPLTQDEKDACKDPAKRAFIMGD